MTDERTVHRRYYGSPTCAFITDEIKECGARAVQSWPNRCALHKDPMSTSNTSARVFITVPAALRAKLEALATKGDETAIDEIVEAALAGDPATWNLPPAHNHMTDRLREKGLCPACDAIHARKPSELESQNRLATVRCVCCAPEPCQNQLRWRGLARCACTDERARPHGGGRSMIVQPDLEG